MWELLLNTLSIRRKYWCIIIIWYWRNMRYSSMITQLSWVPCWPALRILGSPLAWHFKFSQGLQCQQKNLYSSSVSSGVINDRSKYLLSLGKLNFHLPVQKCILLSKRHHKSCYSNWQKYGWRDWGNGMALFKLMNEAEQELDSERLKWAPFD